MILNLARHPACRLIRFQAGAGWRLAQLPRTAAEVRRHVALDGSADRPAKPGAHQIDPAVLPRHGALAWAYSRNASP
jgi:hypothetical protein